MDVMFAKGLQFILDSVHEETGYITKHGTRMYSHAFATLFLAEIYGMTGETKVRKKLEKSIALIVECQNPRGGWRYEPIAMDADMSITVCQVQALRAARNVGIRVPKKSIERAINYISRSAHYSGGFKYQDLPMPQSRITYAITAAGVTALHGAGVYDNNIVKRGLNYLLSPPIKESRKSFSTRHYFFYYGHYYAVQAMYLAGNPYWERWYPRVRDQLVQAQRPNGSWQDNSGRICSTSLAIIILQTPFKYLPIFQR